MFNRRASFRVQLLISFLLLNLIFLTAFGLTIYFVEKSHDMIIVKNKVNRINLAIHNKYKCELGFFLQDVNASSFYENQGSLNLTVRRALDNELDSILSRSIKIDGSETEIELNGTLSKLKTITLKHNNLFDSTKSLSVRKGHKSWGLIGSMRKYAHALENESNTISLSDILQLRRHEKDFLLRNDYGYFLKHSKLGSTFLQTMDSVEQPDYKNLVGYLAQFQQIVSLQQRLGDFHDNGLLHQLQSSFIEIESTLLYISKLVEEKEGRLQSTYRWAFFASLLICLLVAGVFSVVLSRQRAKPLKDLQEAVKRIKEHGAEALNIELKGHSKETLELLLAFRQVIEDLDQQVRLTQLSSDGLKEQNEELQKVNNELDRFVYSISHDLRAPLTSVMGLLELSKGETDETKRKTFHNMMELSVLKLDQFIQDVLNYSRNSRMKIDAVVLNLRNLVQEAYEHLEYAHSGLKIKLELTVNDEWTAVNDKQRLKIVLNNLLSNAIKYSDSSKGYHYIKVSIQTSESEIFIKIEDNGIGISEEHRGRIFDMFYRATKQSKGSGLGLYIVGDVVKTLGGTIQVDSEMGRGSTFYVNLPNMVSLEETSIS